MATEAPAFRAARRSWLALPLVCTAQFMIVLDVTIINVALPSIQRSFGFSRSDLQWVVSALGGRAWQVLADNFPQIMR